MSAGWQSFRELDTRAGTAKGEAFRTFRRLEAGWQDGEDYRLLRADSDAAEIAALRDADRIYRGSVNVVLLSPSRVPELLALLGGTAVSAEAQSQQ